MFVLVVVWLCQLLCGCNLKRFVLVVVCLCQLLCVCVSCCVVVFGVSCCVSCCVVVI